MVLATLLMGGTIVVLPALIDWTKELRVQVDGDVNGFKRRVMTPDIKLMLEELYRTGDRKMLFFGMLEFRTQG